MIVDKRARSLSGLEKPRFFLEKNRFSRFLKVFFRFLGFNVLDWTQNYDSEIHEEYLT